MSTERTRKFMEGLKRNSSNVGYVSKGFARYDENKTENLETILRIEIQNKIREMVKQGCTTVEIKEKLDKEEYKKYSSYFDNWTIGAILRNNIKIKNYIKNQVLLDKTLEEIKQNLSENEVYLKYEDIMNNYLQDCIERRKIEKKLEEERQKLKDKEDEECR